MSNGQRIQLSNVYLKQLKSLLTHKWYVLKAGLMIGGIPLWRLIIHDWSKFSPTEFFRYSRWKYGNATNKSWSVGWLHHLHCSPHHPEHWVLSWHGTPDFYAGIGKDIAPFVSVLPMPETYVREMIADMMATSKEITGYWDIAKWLNEKGAKIHFHDDTTVIMYKVMVELGYFFTDNCDWSYMAGNKFRKWANEFVISSGLKIKEND